MSDNHRFSATVLAVVASTFVVVSSGSERDGDSAAAANSRMTEYTAALEQCGRKQGVHFLKVFGAYWPMPDRFVLLDATNSQLEYTDLAYPWDPSPARSTSTVFYAPKDKFNERWGWLSERASSPAGSACGVSGRKYGHVEEFSAAAVVFTDGKENMLVIGPLTGAAEQMLKCYAETAKMRGKRC